METATDEVVVAADATLILMLLLLMLMMMVTMRTLMIVLRDMTGNSSSDADVSVMTMMILIAMQQMLLLSMWFCRKCTNVVLPDCSESSRIFRLFFYTKIQVRVVRLHSKRLQIRCTNNNLFAFVYTDVKPNVPKGLN